MSDEILKQAIALFDTPEKWKAFLVLNQKKDEIRNRWYAKFTKRVCELTSITEKWDISSWGLWDIKWFLKEFGENSICFWYRDQRRLCLWGSGTLFDNRKAIELLYSEKYSPILSVFTSNYNHDYPKDWLCFEDLNYKIHDTLIEDPDELSFYLGNMTEEMAKTIVDKVNKFRSTEITALLTDLNKECKR